MDIVPDIQAPAVEATVIVEDIEGLHPDMEAQVRLTAYTQRSTPSMRAHITRVSADRLTDNRSGQSYYAAQAKIPAHATCVPMCNVMRRSVATNDIRTHIAVLSRLVSVKATLPHARHEQSMGPEPLL